MSEPCAQCQRDENVLTRLRAGDLPADPAMGEWVDGWNAYSQLIGRDAATALEARISGCGCRPHPDTERLDFIIDAGPPGASKREWLSEEAWNAATEQVDEASTDRLCMRAAIDAARSQAECAGEG